MRPVLSAVAWCIAAIAIALGAAGVVAAMDGPSAGRRAALTAAADRQVAAAHAPIEAELGSIAGEVDALGALARGALAALVANDQDTAAATIAEGDASIAAIRAQAGDVEAGLADVPIVGTREAAYRIGPASTERHAALTDALATVRDLDRAWNRLTIGAISATRLSDVLAAHDDAVLAAAEHGRAADYAAGIDALDAADAAIADARRQRGVLANTVDVSTLDAWLDRSAAYDAALRELYGALDASGGTVTDAVRDAIAAEQAAQARLPPDSRAMVLIMAEIGRGGLNGAVVAIEQARGDLAETLSSAASVP